MIKSNKTSEDLSGDVLVDEVVSKDGQLQFQMKNTLKLMKTGIESFNYILMIT